MIRGGCLCGGVRFEVAEAVGPFELCHCNRCRKASGSAFTALLGVRTRDYRLLAGQELIARYDAPIVESPPAYRVSFCRRCGSPVPDPPEGAAWFGVSAVPAVIFNEKLSLIGAVPVERYRALADWLLAGEPGGVIPIPADEAGASRPEKT